MLIIKGINSTANLSYIGLNSFVITLLKIFFRKLLTFDEAILIILKDRKYLYILVRLVDISIPLDNITQSFFILLNKTNNKIYQLL